MVDEPSPGHYPAYFPARQTKAVDQAGAPLTREDAIAYLSALSHGLMHDDLVEAFVDTGPELVDWIEADTDIRLRVIEGFPDYHPEHPGGRPGGGRSLMPELFPAS